MSLENKIRRLEKYMAENGFMISRKIPLYVFRTIELCIEELRLYRITTTFCQEAAFVFEEFGFTVRSDKPKTHFSIAK